MSESTVFMPASAAKTDLEYLEHRFGYRFGKHGKKDFEKLSQKRSGKRLESGWMILREKHGIWCGVSIKRQGIKRLRG